VVKQGSCVPYILIGELWLATHAIYRGHLDPGIGPALMGIDRIPLVVGAFADPVSGGDGGLPNTVTFTLLISLFSSFAAWTDASVSALLVTFRWSRCR